MGAKAAAQIICQEQCRSAKQPPDRRSPTPRDPIWGIVRAGFPAPILPARGGLDHGGPRLKRAAEVRPRAGGGAGSTVLISPARVQGGFTIMRPAVCKPPWLVA